MRMLGPSQMSLNSHLLRHHKVLWIKKQQQQTFKMWRSLNAEHKMLRLHSEGPSGEGRGDFVESGTLISEVMLVDELWKWGQALMLTLQASFTVSQVRLFLNQATPHEGWCCRNTLCFLSASFMPPHQTQASFIRCSQIRSPSVCWRRTQLSKVLYVFFKDFFKDSSVLPYYISVTAAAVFMIISYPLVFIWLIWGHLTKNTTVKLNLNLKCIRCISPPHA